jgi:hypothetical protein
MKLMYFSWIGEEKIRISVSFYRIKNGYFFVEKIIKKFCNKINILL